MYVYIFIYIFNITFIQLFIYSSTRIRIASINQKCPKPTKAMLTY